jgi:hypothetical protein
MSARSLLFRSGLRIVAALSVLFLPAIATPAAKLTQTCDAANQQAIKLIDEGRDSDAAALLSKTIRQLGEPAEDKFCKGILLINLAIAKYRLSELNAAERAANEALALMEQTLGSRAPELRQPLQVLANFALERDQLRKADELISRIESLPWETHVDLAAWHRLRATLLARKQHKAEAEQENRAAISERALAGHGGSLDAVPDLWNLAVLYLDERRVAAALPLLKRGLEISDASPLNQELRVRILFGLGIAYSAVADRESAERSFQRAVQLIDSVPSGFRSTLGQVLYEAYSSFLKNIGRKQEAKQLRNRGETLYGRDTSGMTVSFDSLLRRQ